VLGIVNSQAFLYDKVPEEQAGDITANAVQTAR